MCNVSEIYFQHLNLNLSVKKENDKKNVTDITKSTAILIDYRGLNKYLYIIQVIFSCGEMPPP